ncbi:DUF2339 domain-containing protein, partial [Dehalococcoidia bacterium]|nr:DUF2339 domain-containing protein [Dehalococcoidia bacterium]
IIGGFSAPFILDGFSETLTDPTTQAQYQILPYTIAVSIGVLILAMFRNWRWLTLLGLAAALACFSAWHNSYGEDASLLLSHGSLTIVFLVYVAATTVFHVARTQLPKTFDQILIVANGAMYFGISCSLLWDDHRPWVGAFSVALALFYTGIGYLIFRRSVENIALSFSSMGMALLFLTVTVPIQFGDSVWTTIVWAVEVPFLIWMSYTRNIPHLRVFAYGVSLILAARLIFFDTGVDLENFNVFLNERVLAFVVAIAGWYLSAYLIGKKQHTESPQPKWELKLVPTRAFLITANFFSLWLITAEVISGFDQHLMGGEQPNVEAIKDAKNLVITTVWAAYAGCLLAVGIVRRSRSIRLAGLGLLTIPIAKVFVYDVFMLSTTYRVTAFIGLGFLLLASGYAYQRFGNLIKGYLANKDG